MRAAGLHAAGAATLHAALALYRTANGWIAFFPPDGVLAAATTWGDAVPHMRALAAAIPQLEAHAAFDGASPADRVAVPPKASARALTAAGAEAPEAAAPVDTWPLRGAPAGDGNTPKRLRLDVGWSVWDAEAEGGDLQAQVRAHLHSPLPPLARSLYPEAIGRTLAAHAHA